MGRLTGKENEEKRMREKEGHAQGQKPGNHQPDRAAVK